MVDKLDICMYMYLINSTGAVDNIVVNMCEIYVRGAQRKLS